MDDAEHCRCRVEPDRSGDRSGAGVTGVARENDSERSEEQYPVVGELRYATEDNEEDGELNEVLGFTYILISR